MEASDSNAWFVATQEIRFVLIACMELLEFDFFFFLLVCFKHLKQNHYVKKVYMHWKTKLFYFRLLYKSIRKTKLPQVIVLLRTVFW